MGQRHSLIAFLSVIAAIVGLAVIAASNGHLDSPTFSTAIAGLVGIAGSFRPRSTATETTP